MSKVDSEIVEQSYLDLTLTTIDSLTPEVFWEAIEYVKLSSANSDIQFQILIILLVWLFINIAFIYMTWQRYEEQLSDKVITSAGLSRQSSLIDKNFGAFNGQDHLKKE